MAYLMIEVVHYLFLSVTVCLYFHLYREVLNNPFAPLSTESWNQTLRKAQLFHASFARKKIRAPQKGRFEDQIAGIKKEWKKGQDLGLQDIVTLKLYTDFDPLQYSLVFSQSLCTYYSVIQCPRNLIVSDCP